MDKINIYIYIYIYYKEGSLIKIFLLIYFKNSSTQKLDRKYFFYMFITKIQIFTFRNDFLEVRTL